MSGVYFNEDSFSAVKKKKNQRLSFYHMDQIVVIAVVVASLALVWSSSIPRAEL